MARRIIDTPDAPGSGGGAPYSQAVVAAGLVFVSGQAPLDPHTGEVVGETAEEQLRQSLANIEAILLAAGSSLDKVVQSTIILRDKDDFAAVSSEWARWFPDDPPARLGALLPVDFVRVSVAVIAEA